MRSKTGTLPLVVPRYVIPHQGFKSWCKTGERYQYWKQPRSM